MSDEAQATGEVAATVEGPDGMTSVGGKPRRVRPVDFTRPIKFSPEQIRRIKQAVDRFCQTTSTNLTAELRTVVECQLIDTEQLTWWDAQTQLSTGAVCGVFAGQPAGIRMLMAADLHLILNAIELLLGSTREAIAPERRLTDIDVALSKRLFESFVHQLSPPWQELCSQSLSLEQFDISPDDVGLAPGSEPTLRLTFDVRIPVGSFGLTLLLPWSAVGPVEGELMGRTDSDSHEDRASAAAVQSVLRDVDVIFRAAAPAVQMPLEQVLALKPGDIVRLEAPVDGGVNIFADDQQTHRGVPGRNGARRAVQILTQHEDIG